ncbi:MAG TPA: PAS domain S-box protein [Cytophagaceae bacterium]|nr:PAS domain S-box protein [Cytophagaceae bacterium]
MGKNDKAVILIVDDKPGNILAMDGLLADKERVLLHANNGKDALKILLNKEVDLIILDVQMPDMDGFEVAQILKSNKRTKDIPIIFASAEKKEHQSMMKGYEEGAIDYLFKPLDPELAKAKVAVLLKIQLQKKELMEKNLSLKRAALLINNSADIIGIIDAATLKIEEINNAFTTILGYSAEETKESTLLFFLSNEDRDMVKEMSKKDNQQFSFDTRIYCKNRSIKWLQWKVVARQGKWFVNARDITEIKQVEKIRNYLATVVKQSNDAVYLHDHEGRIISWNEGAEEIYSYSEHEALNMKIWNIIPSYLLPQIEMMVNKVIQGEKIQDVETKRITKHGKIIDVLFSASVITDPNSDQSSIVINEKDITQQKIAAEQIKQLNMDLQRNVVQLEETNHDLESFSYSVSHDLRAPLRALSGYSKMLEEDYLPVLDEEAKRLLHNIQSNASRMGILIDELLAFSKLGRKKLQKTEVDMQEMVQLLAQEMEYLLTDTNSIRIQQLSPALADPILIRQVWTNLLSNAIKYSSKSKAPQIEIGFEKTAEEICYYVKDNGAGFDMKYADKLFGVFQRMHRQEEFEGTGVGLAIVHKIITKHGGKIWADAKVGEGATFFFTIPLLRI